MKDHYIVCGVGHTGSHVMQELIREGVPFVAVDVRQDLPDDARLSGNPFVVGDATDDDVLERAGIERAAGVAAALHDDAKNLFLVVTARALNPNVRIVANTIEDNSGDKMLRAGANAVVFTGQVGAYRLANQLLRPNVATFTETMSRHDMDPSFDEFCLGDDSPHIGKSLDSLQLQERFHLYPIAIRHGDDRFIYNPPGKYILREQDTLVVIVTTARSKELKQYLRPESETP